jgi:hypothetical protein
MEPMMKKVLLLLLFTLVCVVPASAQVVSGASGSAHVDGPGPNQDFTNLMTVSSGTDRVLVCGIAIPDTTGTPSAVTWDQGGTGQAMTSLGTPVRGGTTGSAFLYGRIAPTSGLHTLRVAGLGAAAEIFVFCKEFTGANQTGGATTFPNYTTNSGTGTGSTVSISSATNNMTVEITSGPQVMTISGTATQIFVNNAGSATSAGASYKAGSASNTHTWSLAGSVNWVVAGVDIVSAGGGAPAATPRLMLLGVGDD